MSPEMKKLQGIKVTGSQETAMVRVRDCGTLGPGHVSDALPSPSTMNAVPCLGH